MRAELHERTGILFDEYETDDGPENEPRGDPGQGTNSSTANGTLSSQVRGWIAQRAGRSRERRTLVEQFISQVMGFGEVELELGRSSRSQDGLGRYVMLRSSGPRDFGAAMYVYPGTARVNFHLPAKRAKGRQFAKANNSQRAYQVTTYLTTPEAVDEAIEVAKEALEDTRNPK